MKTNKIVTLVITGLLTIIVSACNSNQSKNDQVATTDASVAKTENTQKLYGDYVCTEHWNSDLVGSIKISFDNDSVNFSGIGKTSYRIKDDSLFIDMHTYEMGFAVDGNTLKSSGPAGKVAYTKK